jgi:hypothetical protein
MPEKLQNDLQNKNDVADNGQRHIAFLLLISVGWSDRNGSPPCVHSICTAAKAAARLAEQTAQQGDQGGADQSNTAARHELCYP